MKDLPVRSVVLNRISLTVVLLCILLAGCESEPAVTPTAVQPSPPVVGQVTAVIQPTMPPTASPKPATDTPTVTSMPATTTPTDTAVPPTATATASLLPASNTPTAVPVIVTEPPMVTAEPPRITCNDVSDWFFENPPDSCAAAPPVHSYAAAQRFEHGLMVWIEASDEFMVFFNDNTFRIFYPPLILKPGASVDNRVGGAPDGYFEPVSGFGLIWRGEVEYSENMRSTLGWALEPEFGFDTTYQRGILTTWHYLDRYMRDPEGRIIYFFGQIYLVPRWMYWEGVAGW